MSNTEKKKIVLNLNYMVKDKVEQKDSTLTSALLSLILFNHVGTKGTLLQFSKTNPIVFLPNKISQQLKEWSGFCLLLFLMMLHTFLKEERKLDWIRTMNAPTLSAYKAVLLGRAENKVRHHPEKDAALMAMFAKLEVHYSPPHH